MTRRRRLSILLAGVFLAELVAAVALPVQPVRDRPATSTQLVAPVAGAGPAQVVVGDRTARLVSLGGPATDRLLSRVAANMGGAVDAVVAFWGADWSHEISVIATGSDEQFRAAAGGGLASQWADIAAVMVVDSVDPDHRVAVGQRIVLAADAGQMSEYALRIVLTHELFHYAARAGTALDAPRWLTEGVADYVARPKDELPTDAVSKTLSLPSDTDLDTPGPQRSVAYDRAWWFARFVADSYGQDKLREFYLAACGIGHPDLPTAVRDVFGISSAKLLARWQHWLTG